MSSRSQLRFQLMQRSPARIPVTVPFAEHIRHLHDGYL